jgi:hypothetical protein
MSDLKVRPPTATQTRHPPPMFFVSIASKVLNVYVSSLESTHTGSPTSVDSKGVALHQNCARATSLRAWSRRL